MKHAVRRTKSDVEGSGQAWARFSICASIGPRRLFSGVLNGRAQRVPAPVRARTTSKVEDYSVAMTSISTRASFGSRTAWIVARAGAGCVKYEP